jgi:hypothetical protein
MKILRCSHSTQTIAVACKRNAAVWNIARGSDEDATFHTHSPRTFHLVKSTKVGKMDLPGGRNVSVNQ